MLDMKKLLAYELLEEQDLPEVQGKGYVLSHKKTKARVLLVLNEDKNKVFTIGFRTPPADDTGVPHITEHSVLCGSKEFPVKDPFVELAKGSLNTFLNAMTYADKTVYPVASMNDADFHNLMHVYLDAVFYPNIYERSEILMQEGWHYELDDDGELTVNGVVYNEMRGVYSSADQQLAREIQSSLLTGAPYGYDSGGDPAAITKLTQADFEQFHRTYYHPSNSYIYLYGNLDAEKELAFIDEKYLSDFDYLKVDSEIGLTEAFSAPVHLVDTYSLAEGDEEKDNTYLSYNAVVGESKNVLLTMAFSILSQVLLDVPGAPLKKALIDAGVGKDVYSSFDDGIRQPVFSVIAQNANPEDEARFIEIIETTIREICEKGVNKRSLEAAINHLEFRHKEANFGRFPKGLMYGLDAFNTWLYDDSMALTLFTMNPVFKELRQKVGTGYYEDILKTYILDNPHKSQVILMPEKGKTGREDEKKKKELAAYKATLSEEEIKSIDETAKHLKAYQSEPSTPEELATIPLLAISDIDREAKKINNTFSEIEMVKVVSHKIFTNGISYVNLVFNMDDLRYDRYPYVSLLTDILKYVDTEKHTMNEMAAEIDYHTGGIGFSTVVSSIERGEKPFTVQFSTNIKCLDEKLPVAFELTEELLFSSKLDDRKRLREIIAECRANLKNDITSSGHNMAAARAMSYISDAYYAKELLEGISYYEFLADLDDHFDEKCDELVEMLSTVIGELLSRGNLIVNFTSDLDVKEALGKPLTKLSNMLSTRLSFDKEDKIEVKTLNEGFMSASQVQYVATAGDFSKKGLTFTGALDVLSTIFSYDYLWINVRVKGGAYGSMCGFQRTGISYFTSYRDPNLMKTYEIYQKAADYVAHFDCDERDLTKYIIGAIAKMDMPLTPSAEGSFSFGMYIKGLTDEDLQRERDEVLATDVCAIRNLAPYVAALSESNILVAIGDENKIKKEQAHFNELKEIK